MTNRFTGTFGHTIIGGESIQTEPIDGIVYTAQIILDEHSDSPDKEQDGFWPSLDPKDAGFIGEGNTQADLDNEREQAEKVLQAWQDGAWFYVGVSIYAVDANGWRKDRLASLWRIEANYPPSAQNPNPNSYLTEAANELLDEAIAEAKRDANGQTSASAACYHPVENS